MKLLFCKKCKDAFNLQEQIKRCSCGAIEGRYTDSENAEYSGDAISFAVDNNSFRARASESPDSLANQIYDSWYSEGKIQAWILQEGMPNFDSIKQVERQIEQPKKALGKCGIRS